MTILTEVERVNAEEWYEEGSTYWEIGERILQERENALHFNTRRAIIQEIIEENAKNIKEVQL